MDKILKNVGAVFLIVLGAAALSLLLTYPLMWAVNWLIAPTLLLKVFGVVQLSFWRTWVLSFVCSGLFKSSFSSKKD